MHKYIYIYVVGASTCTKPPSPRGGVSGIPAPGCETARNPPPRGGGFRAYPRTRLTNPPLPRVVSSRQ